MARQGQFFDHEEIKRIISLLATTDMSIKEIAERMCCTRNAIAAINRKYRIRNYNGGRARWEVLDSRNDVIRLKMIS